MENSKRQKGVKENLHISKSDDFATRSHFEAEDLVSTWKRFKAPLTFKIKFPCNLKSVQRRILNIHFKTKMFNEYRCCQIKERKFYQYGGRDNYRCSFESLCIEIRNQGSIEYAGAPNGILNLVLKKSNFQRSISFYRLCGKRIWSDRLTPFQDSQSHCIKWQNVMNVELSQMSPLSQLSKSRKCYKFCKRQKAKHVQQSKCNIILVDISVSWFHCCDIL